MDKPALLRRLFDLACRYSGQILSSTNMFGPLQDAGSLLQVLTPALMTVTAGVSPQEVRSDREFRGRLIESAVGAHLANAAATGECELSYWRDRGQEGDFVVKAYSRLIAIEVKSGRAPQAHVGTAAFAAAFNVRRTLLVGGDGIAVEDFLNRHVAEWLASSRAPGP